MMRILGRVPTLKLQFKMSKTNHGSIFSFRGKRVKDPGIECQNLALARFVVSHSCFGMHRMGEVPLNTVDTQ